MRLQKYLVNEMNLPSWIINAFNRVKKELSRMSFEQLNKKCERAFNDILNIIDPDELSALLKKLDIDEHTFRNKLFKENITLDEDAKHWWDLVKGELFPTLSFWPALQVWLEIDKMIKGTEYSGNIIGFYAAFWLVLISGKYVKGWKDWKKSNPEMYSKERAVGGGGII